MTSNGSLKEFTLITKEECCFLKNQPQNESKRLEYRKIQKNQKLAQVTASLPHKLFGRRDWSFHESPLSTRSKRWLLITFNSMFKDQIKPSTQSSTSQENTDYQQNNTSDKVSGSLLLSGMAGGKIERWKEIFKVIQKTTASPLMTTIEMFFSINKIHQ